MNLRLTIVFCFISLSCWAQNNSVSEFYKNDPLIFKKGKLQIPSSYLKNIAFEKDIAQITLKDTINGKKDQKVGYINLKGKILIEPKYNKGERSSFEIIAVLNDSGGWEFYKIGSGFIPQMESIQEYQIVSSQYILFSRNNKWGILNINKKENQTIVEPIYKRIEYVSGNTFKFHPFNSWSLKNINNEVVNLFSYDSLSFSNDTLLSYQLNKASGFINFKDQEILVSDQKKLFKSDNSVETVNNHSPKETELKVYKRIINKNKIGIADSSGKIIVPATYDSIRGPYENIFVVFNAGQMGIINNEGEVYSELSNRFEKVFPYKEGRAKIIKAGKFGFIDLRGNVRVAPQYSSVHDFREGLAAVIINGKWGFVDKDENIVVQPHYSEVYDFKNGIARAKAAGKWYFVNKEGKKFTNAYDEIREIGIDKWELIRNNKKGLANKDGKELLAPRYDFLEDVDSSVVIVKKGDKWGVVDYNENFLFPIEFDFITYNKSKKIFLLMKKTLEVTTDVSK